MQPWPSRPYPNDDVFDARVPFNAKPFYIASLFRCFGYETNDFEQFTMDGCVVCIIFCLLLACYEGDPRAKWLSHIRRNRQSLVCCRCNFSPSRNVEKREWIASFYGYMEIFQHGDDWIVCWAACCFEEKRKCFVRYLVQLFIIILFVHRSQVESELWAYFYPLAGHNQFRRCTFFSCHF